jgi:kynurenine formamidase
MQRFFSLLLVAGLAAAPSSAARAEDPRIVDLSHAYDEATIFWPTEEGFVLERGAAGMTEAGYWYAAHRFRTPEHGGTHIDAPIHFAQGGHSVDEIPLDRLLGPAIVVDVSDACTANPDHQVPVEAFVAWERQHGRISDGAIVLLRTGFERFWPNRLRYLGTDERGAAAVAKLRFPGLHPAAARWLVDERRIHAVGLDTASIDYGLSKSFETHQILSAANVPVFENLMNLRGLPARGFDVIALPMKIRGGSGGPLRAVALVPPAEPAGR